MGPMITVCEITVRAQRPHQLYHSHSTTQQHNPSEVFVQLPPGLKYDFSN